MAERNQPEQYNGFSSRFSPEVTQDLLFLVGARFGDAKLDRQNFWRRFYRKAFLRDKALDSLIGTPAEFEVNVRQTFLRALTDGASSSRAREIQTTWVRWGQRMLYQHAPALYREDWDMHMLAKRDSRTA